MKDLLAQAAPVTWDVKRSHALLPFQDVKVLGVLAVGYGSCCKEPLSTTGFLKGPKHGLEVEFGHWLTKSEHHKGRGF